MTHCPRCHQPLITSETLVPGSIVLGCRNCRQFTVEGSGQWVSAGPDFRESLRLIAEFAKEKQRAVEAVMITPITDPRWERIS